MSSWDELKEEARALARTHLSMYDMTDCPTNLPLLCQRLGIRLVSEPCWPDPEYDGGAVWTEDGSYRAIIVNSLMPRTRWAFTIAHELGHLAMGHYPPRRQTHEELANTYASELLMPTPRLVSQIQRFGADVRYLAGLNGVSLWAMRRRLEELATLAIIKHEVFSPEE